MAFDGLRIMFLTGSLDVYSEETLRKVSEQSTRIVEGLRAAPDIPVEIVQVPTLLHPDGIRRACLEATADDRCIGVIAWMHTFSPGQDVDRAVCRRSRSRCSTCTRSSGATCPGRASTWTS